jgi:hypothetical protein
MAHFDEDVRLIDISLRLRVGFSHMATVSSCKGIFF